MTRSPLQRFNIKFTSFRFKLTGHFVMVPLNMTCLHCMQHSLFVHLFNLYYVDVLLPLISLSLSS